MAYKCVIKLPCGARISSGVLHDSVATAYYRRMIKIYRYADVKLKWHFVK